MKKEKNLNKKLLYVSLSSMSLIGVSFTTNIISSSAEESTQVLGTFQSTILDVQIPAVSNFIYNPNTQEMISSEIDIKSETNAPIYMKLQEINVAEESAWKPNLVEPNKYTSEQWKNLTQEKSLKEISLGLSPLTSPNWLYELENEHIWTNDTKVGTIKTKGIIKVKPRLQAGTSLTTEKILKTNYVFEFGLEDGEELTTEKTPINYDKTSIDMTTEQLFGNLSNASAPTIIGKELFSVDYFDSTKIYVYDTESKKLKRTMSYQSKQTVNNSSTMKRFYSMGTDGENLLVFSSANVIDVIDKTTGKIIGTKKLDKSVGNINLIGSPTFVVEKGYLYVTPFYSTSIYIYNYETGVFIKEIPGFNSTSGVSIRNGSLVVLERNLKQIHLFKLIDPLNPVKEGTLKIENGYDNVGLTMDDNYAYIATYISNKIVRYPLITK